MDVAQQFAGLSGPTRVCTTHGCWNCGRCDPFAPAVMRHKRVITLYSGDTIITRFKGH
jgi:hypothetical protein